MLVSFIYLRESYLEKWFYIIFEFYLILVDFIDIYFMQELCKMLQKK